MFWKQFFRHNAKFFIKLLEQLIPGPPAFGLMILGGKMGVVTHKDTDPAFTATVTFVDADGNPTQPDNPPTWSSDTPGVAAVAPVDATGLTATVTPGGSVGAAVITCTTTDNDGTVVTSQGTVTIVAGEAVVGDIEFS